jgi:hypothetical protein
MQPYDAPVLGPEGFVWGAVLLVHRFHGTNLLQGDSI